MADAGLAKSLRDGRTVFAAWLNVPSPATVETMTAEGFDAAILDMQHGGFDFAGAEAGIASAAMTRTPVVARIPVGDYPTASRLLDAGAAGIIAPMVESVADARTLVEFTKYPPIGKRSWGPRRATRLSGREGQAYFEAANALHLAIAMIETRDALDALDGILAVEGIDGVFVGPSDLSIALSRGAGVDPGAPAVDAALSRVVECARAAGKAAGVFTFSGASARAMAVRGFALVSISTDLLLLRAAARAELAAARRRDATA